MARRHLLRHRVDFVTPTSSRSNNIDDIKEEPDSGVSHISGWEAKNFYLSVINSESDADNKSAVKRHCKKQQLQRKRRPNHEQSNTKVVPYKSSRTAPYETVAPLKFFSLAQGGDLTRVKVIITNQAHLMEMTDEFGWTALMISAHAGHSDIVKYLLMKGATWCGILDGSGRDAYKLACLGGHANIAHLLVHHQTLFAHDRIKQMTEDALRAVKKEQLWCPDCNSHYFATSDGRERINGHHSSIPHQLSKMEKTAQPNPGTYFFLNNRNQGFRMLKQQGWDGESGLGPQQDGKKFPVKTVLKRDRKGFGLEEKAVARVTHFAPGDTSSISRIPRKNYKKEKSVAEMKEKKFKEFEIDFRRSFHS